MTAAEAHAALEKFFSDLGVLRHVPLAWLVPDEALLPPESARFFFLDGGFVRHLIAGACAAGGLGGDDTDAEEKLAAEQIARLNDALFSLARQNAAVHYTIYGIQLPGVPASPPPDDRHLYQPTGVLLRSAAVGRFPGIEARAFARFHPSRTTEPDVALPLLRLERVAPGVLLALFLGIPDLVELEEPGVGTRFGFDVPKVAGQAPTLQLRDLQGKLGSNAIDVPLRGRRVVDLLALGKSLAQAGAPGAVASTLDGAALAFQLQQAPYIQEFRLGADAADASAVQAALAPLGGTP